MSDWWRLDTDDDRFVREAQDAWLYGPADPRLEGLRVPGARDVALGEVVPPDIERPRRPDGYVFFRASVVAREPALSFVGGPAIGEYLGVPVKEWEPHQGELVGMRAPELRSDGPERDLALAEREVRVWRREKGRAARRRASLVLHAREDLGASGADVARWIGVTRNRVHQLCEEGVAANGARPADPEAGPEAVKSAHRAFVQADRMLHRAEAMRRVRVALACDEGGLSLGAVARVLDLSRPRAQQLRDAGRIERRAA